MFTGHTNSSVSKDHHQLATLDARDINGYIETVRVNSFGFFVFHTGIIYIVSTKVNPVLYLK
jgi:hypothetical protein